MLSKRPIVIAVSGVAGSGKTTITKELLKMNPCSEVLSFDEYDFPKCPSDFVMWVEQGANLEDWDLTPIRNDLNRHLLDHQRNLDFIFLDYPFSRLHKEIGELIDYTVFIDTPLDIALARRIKRDIPKSVKDLMSELDNYLMRGRIAYLDMQSKHVGTDDIVIDGSLSIEEIVNTIISKIREKPDEA